MFSFIFTGEYSLKTLFVSECGYDFAEIES